MDADELKRLRKEAMTFFVEPDKSVIEIESDADFVAWLNKHKKPVYGSDGWLKRWILVMYRYARPTNKSRELVWEATEDLHKQK